jgi:hypothetical protein
MMLCSIISTMDFIDRCDEQQRLERAASASAGEGEGARRVVGTAARWEDAVALGVVPKGGPVLGRRHFCGAASVAQLRRDGRRQAAGLCLCRQAVPRLGEALGVECGPAARHGSAGGKEWEVVAESVEAGALLLGEAKWTEKAPAAGDIERAAQGLVAKGRPPLAGREEAEARYAVFVSRRPKGKLKLPSNVAVIDARDVFEALR